MEEQSTTEILRQWELENSENAFAHRMTQELAEHVHRKVALAYRLTNLGIYTPDEYVAQINEVRGHLKMDPLSDLDAQRVIQTVLK